MSTESFGRVAGLGGILAGLSWLLVAATSIAGQERIFSSTFWHYVAALAAALILVAALALYFQEGHKVSGTIALAVLAIGSLAIALSELGNALQITFDPDEGLRFFSFVFGTILQGMGLAMIGYRYRSPGQSTGRNTLLAILGLILALGYPAVFIYHFAVTMRHTEVLFGFLITAQALAWMILGSTTFSGTRNTVERPAASAA